MYLQPSTYVGICIFPLNIVEYSGDTLSPEYCSPCNFEVQKDRIKT